MIVSHRHRFLFVHVPKTAGTSISRALAPFNDSPPRTRLHRYLQKRKRSQAFLPVRWRFARKHATALDLLALYPARVFDDYFKFAFVRNPWDLMVSYYHFLVSNPKHGRHTTVRRLGNFRAYLQYEIHGGILTQSRHVCDERGDVLVDAIGRFENLEENFARMSTTIGISPKLGHHNKTERGDYRSSYTDETAEWVAQHWAEDIARFGYRFADPFPQFEGWRVAAREA